MKKKHLSGLVTERIVMVAIGIFITLMVITAIFIYFYGKSRTDSLIRFSLEDEKRLALNRVFANWEINVPGEAMGYSEIIPDHGVDSEEIEKAMSSFHDSNRSEEVNIVDRQGIVAASTEKGNIGYDLHSDPRSAEFLCLLDGRTNFYFQELGESPLNGKMMCYRAAPIPGYGGIYLEGLPEEGLIDYEKTFFAGQVTFDRLGKNGYFLFADEDNKIMGSPQDRHNGESLILSEDIRRLSESGRIIKDTVFGVSSYVGVTEAGIDHIIAVYPVSEAWETWNVAMLVLLVLYILIFLLLFFFMRRMIVKQVVNGVYSLNGSLGRITGGDLEEKADFRDSLEFEELSDSINYTVGWLKELIREAEERIDAELTLAARIQTSFLPHGFPPFPDRNEFELFAAMVPAKEVGGDFYDYFLVDDDHLALVMADVSGKGIPAAMFMVMAKNKIRYSVQKYGSDVAEALREVNLELCRENDEGLFVTVWLGVFTLSTGHMDYVNAGHEYPAISRKGGAFTTEEDLHDAPVAAWEMTKFEAGFFEMDPGDVLFLYTDGVTDANDLDGEMFRRSRMLEALNNDTGAAVQDIDAAVRSAISDFVKEAPQFDDTTTLVFRYKGSSG